MPNDELREIITNKKLKFLKETEKNFENKKKEMNITEKIFLIELNEFFKSDSFD